MTDITIRHLTGDEWLETMYRLNTYAFRPSPPLADRAEFWEHAQSRAHFTYYALFENGCAVAGAASTPMTQRVRGALYPMGGIIAVSTEPAARRRGYSRRVLARLLEAVRDQGRPLTCLYPFRESFYERLGYVSFPVARKATLSPLSLRPLVKLELAGRVEQLLSSEAYEQYYAYTRRLQQRTHGMAVFDVPDVVGLRRNPLWLILARVDGEVAGLMVYDLKGDDIGAFKMRVRRFYYDSSLARYLLLQWIGLHADQAAEAEIWLPAFELPETWLADLFVVTRPLERAPMGRVLDVAGIGGMAVGPGRFAARIVDPICPWNEGTWQFESADGVLCVSPGGEADCELSIHGLSALIYGTHDPGDFPIRGWGRPSAATQATMLAIFPRLVPHIHEFF